MQQLIDIFFTSCHTHSDIINNLQPVIQLPSTGSFKVVFRIYKNFIFPDHLTLIAVVANSALQRNSGIKFEVLCNPSIKQFLSRINFFQLLNIPFEEDFLRRNPSGKFTEITKYKIADNDPDFRIACNSVVEIIKTKANIDRSIVDSLGFCLLEIMDNVRHSGEEVGWVIAQYYPERNEIRIMIADTGKGIHLHLNQ